MVVEKSTVQYWQVVESLGHIHAALLLIPEKVPHGGTPFKP